MDYADRRRMQQGLDSITAGAEHQLERIQAQIDFAEGLGRLHPSRRAGISKLVAHARQTAEQAIASGKGDRLAKAVRQVEQVLTPLGKLAKRYTIHCVGHAHIDMNWQWSWPETVALTNDTFITVLKLMDEFPEFCFTQSQASVYAIMQKYNPQLFEQIKRRVAEGRWEIAAAHWVEGDKNIASGESLTRHLLYTRRYFREHFGLEPENITLDWEPDTFGHAVTIPTIVSRGAVTRYYMCRGGDSEKPRAFWWQGPDGSRILVYFDPTGYGDSLDPHIAKSLLTFCEKTGLKDWMCVYGVGDHGGGPTRRDIMYGLEMDTCPVFPNVKFTTTGKYYPILEKHADKLPVLDCELNFVFAGCYTSQSAIKEANRHGENELVEAEAAAVLALRAVGQQYPTEMLRQAWIDTLFGHFHDILPGSGVRATRHYQLGLAQQVTAATGMVKTNSLRAVAEKIDTAFADVPAELTKSTSPTQVGMGMGAGAGRGTETGELSDAAHVCGTGRSVVVFNPTAWDRTEVVTATVWDVASPGGSFVVTSSDGGSVQAQRMGEGKYWGHSYVDLAFRASAKALGYTAYTIVEGEVDDYQGAVKCHTKFADGGDQNPGMAIENEFLLAVFDRNTGGVTRLVDKTTGRDLADADNPLGLLEYVLERPGGMSAWTIHDRQKRICPLEITAFKPRRFEQGPHVGSMVATMKLNDSTFDVTYTLKAGQRQLEIVVSANWLERGSQQIGTPSLRMQFPLALTDATARYEVPFGSIERSLDSGQEVPALRWADVTGKVPGGNASAGCTLLNNSKYGHSLDGSTLRLSLIRSSYSPDPLPEQGEHEIRMALVPHGKAMPVADLVRLGAAFNDPLQVVNTDVHAGELPATSGAIVESRPANVIVSAIKKAEDENAVVVRLCETAGKPTQARVRLHAGMMGTVSRAVEVDLMERELDESSAKAAADGFSVKVPAYGIASVKLSFA